MNEDSYLAWAKSMPHTYEVNFDNSILVPQINDFPELKNLGNIISVKPKRWRIESIVPELDIFSQCFLTTMQKHHVPAENYTITQLTEEKI
ncbi:hypothetical protein [Liquorilactobacillus capillatus]|uniref:Uncharacterized protein n=1 Tax=Liquorilactobacillus capillatus DSM 19910 TaxID=1423731 RepID=A0A0R1M623_9LACO|nr:hypothetical protein [Liquorilactobacillus capillatus]KRL00466.1 hypothetical protein FC81_GL001995 [Liquorilactobacillus capillatus DSM 19910]